MTLIPSAGIHHVTTLASDAARTTDFHVRVLGLRLVKRTVNFDDPGTWHLYFGDATGAPGTLLTLFPYAGLPAGRAGAGQFVRVRYAVPVGALGWWADHLAAQGVEVAGPLVRFGERLLTLRDPDGLAYDLVESGFAEALPGWADGAVPAAFAIRGLHGVELQERPGARTGTLLQDLFGFVAGAADGAAVRYVAAAGPGLGATVDIVGTLGDTRALGGAGTVHHVAFRAADAAHHAALRAAVAARLPVTEVIDRTYFHSVYFRTPGGALFEIATDPPGMLIDEPLATLGTTLQLPPHAAAAREMIEAGLPALFPEVPA